jgi:methionyl-tRNA formyltransferase
LKPRRLVYLGSPEAAVPPLRALVDAGFDIRLVVSQPDRKRGRGGALLPSPVKAAALELRLPVTDRVDDVLDTDAELGVVVAFGKLVKPHVLERLPMVNLHFSLLPRWRGAAPVERALLAGDAETGVGVMQLEVGLDTGGLYAEERVAIGPEETAEELRARLVAVGTDLLVRTLTEGLGEPVPQSGEPTYAAKLDPAEMAIDWARSAPEVHRLVRLGRAWTTFRGKRLKVLSARIAPPGEPMQPGAVDGLLVGTAGGALELVTVQPEGKGPQAASDWRNGARPQPGEQLGD